MSTATAPAPTTAATNRFQRQEELVPADKLASIRATVIGVGAVGRNVALQLAAIGTPRLQLIDFDHVDLTNITTQGYRHKDVGKPKVEALAVELADLDADLKIDKVLDRWRPSLAMGNAVFCCVDNIEARKVIWDVVGQECPPNFWCDARMLGEVVRVLPVGTDEARDYYAKQFFAASEAVAGRCTARSTIYAANVAAALMVQQFARWLRGGETDMDVMFNLAMSELDVK